MDSSFVYRSLKLFLAIFIFLSALAFLSANPVSASSVTGLAVIGDSGTDEYRADDNRGSPYGSTTFNWLEQLVRFRGINAGPWGNWGGPRRTGYEFNWSRSGYRTSDMIANGEHTGVANLVSAGRVSHVFVIIGNNDFMIWNGSYAEIYNGTLSGSALQTKINNVITDITTAVDRVRSAGNARIVIVSLSDEGLSAAARSQFPDATRRQRVTDAIVAVNSGLSSLAASRNAVYVDTLKFAQTLFANLDSRGYYHIENELINMVQMGNEPHYGILTDNHPGTVLSGLVANYYIAALNSNFNTGITPFTNAEILTHAGIYSAQITPTRVPSPTLTPTIATKIGDADGDGDVDGVDFTRWLNHYDTRHTNGPSWGDFDNSGLTDGIDFTLWLNRYEL